MKKGIAILLAFVMLLSLAACGKTENTDNITKKPTGNTKADIVTPLFTLDYDENVWSYFDEETKTDEDYCCVLLQIPDPEDPEYYYINAEIKVSIDEPYDFREDLVYYGFDQYEYEVNKNTKQSKSVALIYSNMKMMIL